MEDKAMISIIDNGEEFSKGDYMLVDLEVETMIFVDKENKEHIKSGKVGKLF